MKNGSVRAGSLLVGLAGALALPAAAMGQLDPVGDTVTRAGQTVQQTVPQALPEIKAPAPVQSLTRQPQPSAPAPAPKAPQSVPAAPSSPQSAPAASPSAGSSSSAAPAPSAGKASPSSSQSRGRKSGTRASKAHAASSATPAKAPSVALGQTESDTTAEPGDAGSFTAGTQAEPATLGDSRLPFTGGYALMFLALGAGVLLTGLVLRGATRTRLARRHG